jgi:hypothetical protein
MLPGIKSFHIVQMNPFVCIAYKCFYIGKTIYEHKLLLLKISFSEIVLPSDSIK